MKVIVKRYRRLIFITVALCAAAASAQTTLSGNAARLIQMSSVPTACTGTRPCLYSPSTGGSANHPVWHFGGADTDLTPDTHTPVMSSVEWAKLNNCGGLGAHDENAGTFYISMAMTAIGIRYWHGVGLGTNVNCELRDMDSDTQLASGTLTATDGAINVCNFSAPFALNNPHRLQIGLYNNSNQLLFCAPSPNTVADYRPIVKGISYGPYGHCNTPPCNVGSGISGQYIGTELVYTIP